MKGFSILFIFLLLSIAVFAQRKKVIGGYSDGMAWVKQNGKYGFQNEKGELVIPIKYDSVFSFTEGLAAVKVDSGWFYINKRDSAAHDYSAYNDNPSIAYWEIARPYYKNLAVVKNFSSNDGGYEDFSDWTIIDKQGYGAFTDFQADSIGAFNDDYTEIVYGNKHGIIDISKDELVPAIYDDVDSFSNGWVKVKLNGKWMLLNPYGECVNNCEKQIPQRRKYNSNFHTFRFPNILPKGKMDDIMRLKVHSLISFMERNPNVKMVIAGNGSSSYTMQQRSWDYVNAIIDYVIDNGKVNRNQFIFQYGLGGEPRTVNIRKAQPGEEGPNNTPPPIPFFTLNLKLK